MICSERGKPNVCKLCAEEKACIDMVQHPRCIHQHSASRCRTCIAQGALAYYYENQEHRREYGRQYRLKDPARNARQQRRNALKRWGLTPEQYDSMLERQGGGCALCEKAPEENGKSLAVDHDHACCPDRRRSCGSCVRGLLCDECNLNLYPLEDREWARRALNYLDRGRE